MHQWHARGRCFTKKKHRDGKRSFAYTADVRSREPRALHVLMRSAKTSSDQLEYFHMCLEIGIEFTRQTYCRQRHALQRPHTKEAEYTLRALCEVVGRTVRVDRQSAMDATSHPWGKASSCPTH
mmetsp:Transcript_69080/g.192283  ORF Transcript_69080/g.192283 Transcript_69080/m.192283 type:complete len:124 (-) Transcript_69080:40-411(-)